MDFSIDQNTPDNTTFIEDKEQTEEIIQDEQLSELRQQQEEQQQAQDQAVQEEQDKKVNYVSEFGNAVIGGVASAVQDIVTLPERVVDIASGEAAQEGYKPNWIDHDLYSDPDEIFETKTWWGGLIKNAINVATLFVPISGWMRGAGILPERQELLGSCCRWRS